MTLSLTFSQSFFEKNYCDFPRFLLFQNKATNAGRSRKNAAMREIIQNSGFSARLRDGWHLCSSCQYFQALCVDIYISQNWITSAIFPATWKMYQCNFVIFVYLQYLSFSKDTYPSWRPFWKCPTYLLPSAQSISPLKTFNDNVLTWKGPFKCYVTLFYHKFDTHPPLRNAS